MCLDRPNSKSYFDFTALQPVGTVPGPFRATFGLLAKSAPAKNTNFASDGDNRFMRPSWARVYGLISRIYHTVWACAPAYRRLSSPRSRIRENRGLKIGPNCVAILVKVLCIFYIYCAYILKSYFVLDRNLAVATNPKPFRPTFCFPKKVPWPKVRIFP